MRKDTDQETREAGRILHSTERYQPIRGIKKLKNKKDWREKPRNLSRIRKKRSDYSSSQKSDASCHPGNLIHDASLSKNYFKRLVIK